MKTSVIKNTVCSRANLVLRMKTSLIKIPSFLKYDLRATRDTQLQTSLTRITLRMATITSRMTTITSEMTGLCANRDGNIFYSQLEDENLLCQTYSLFHNYGLSAKKTRILHASGPIYKIKSFLLRLTRSKIVYT